MFSDKHKERPSQKHYQLIGIGVDYGQQNATTYQCFGLDIYNRKIEGLTEYYYSGRDEGKQKAPSEYALDFIQMTDSLYEEYACNVFYVYIDPSAKGLAEEIKRAIADRMYQVSIKDADNAVALGISRVQKCLTYHILTVNPIQEKLIEEFGLYEYDKNLLDKGKEVPVKVKDHAMDALRYLVMGLWSKLKYFLPAGEREDES